MLVRFTAFSNGGLSGTHHPKPTQPLSLPFLLPLIISLSPFTPSPLHSFPSSSFLFSHSLFPLLSYIIQWFMVVGFEKAFFFWPLPSSKSKTTFDLKIRFAFILSPFSQVHSHPSFLSLNFHPPNLLSLTIKLKVMCTYFSLKKYLFCSLFILFLAENSNIRVCFWEVSFIGKWFDSEIFNTQE